MDTASMLAELRVERDRISHAINALEALQRTNTASRKPGRPKGQGNTAVKKRRGITAAGRRRLSEMMKKRWAERRKNQRGKAKAVAA
jgi:hypothetical protein